MADPKEHKSFRSAKKVASMLGMTGWQVVHSGVLFQLRSTLGRGTLKRPRVCVVEELRSDGLIIEGRMRGYSAKHPDRLKFEIKLSSETRIEAGQMNNNLQSSSTWGSVQSLAHFHIICSDSDGSGGTRASAANSADTQVQWQMYSMCTEDDDPSSCLAWMDAIKRVKYNVLLCYGGIVNTAGSAGAESKKENIKFDTLSFSKDIVGRGASGVVYKGTWHGQTVAIKKITVEEEEQKALVDEVANEASMLARLQHPYIAVSAFCSLAEICVSENPSSIPHCSCRVSTGFRSVRRTWHFT